MTIRIDCLECGDDLKERYVDMAHLLGGDQIPSTTEGLPNYELLRKLEERRAKDIVQFHKSSTSKILSKDSRVRIPEFDKSKEHHVVAGPWKEPTMLPVWYVEQRVRPSGQQHLLYPPEQH